MTPADVQQYLDGLTKPPGSLGRLEESAVRLATIQQTLAPKTSPRRLVIFAADHGVVEAGVSLWPSSVTGLMVANILNGGAASSVLAAQFQTELHLVDVGTQSEPLPRRARYFPQAIRKGSRNLAHESALTRAEFDAAWAIGSEHAQHAKTDGIRLVIAGEMGIGNSTPAACLAMLLANVPLEYAVGPGAGTDETRLAKKREVVAHAVDRARVNFASNPIDAIAAVAGLEIVAIAGFFAKAAEEKLTILLDGYIATAGLLIAETLAPGTTTQVLAGHCSAEPGHQLMLDFLCLSPILENWELRLGEGTGALLALPLLDASAAILTSMATLASFGIAPDA